MNWLLRWTALLVVLAAPVLYKKYQFTDTKEHLRVFVTFGDRGFTFHDAVLVAQLEIDHQEHEVLPDRYHVELVDCLNHACEYDRQWDFTLELLLLDSDTIAVDSESLTAFLFYQIESIHSNDLPFYMAQAVLYHLLAAEHDDAARDHYEVPDLLVTVSNHWPMVEYVAELQRYFSTVRLVEVDSEYSQVEIGAGSRPVMYATYDDMCTAVEKALGLPRRPNNNVRLKVEARLRRQRLGLALP